MWPTVYWWKSSWDWAVNTHRGQTMWDIKYFWVAARIVQVNRTHMLTRTSHLGGRGAYRPMGAQQKPIWKSGKTLAKSIARLRKNTDNTWTSPSDLRRVVQRWRERHTFWILRTMGKFYPSSSNSWVICRPCDKLATLDNFVGVVRH